MRDGLSFPEVASVIEQTGASVTYVVTGEMGVGKSAVLRHLAGKMPGHTPVLFDCAVASVGDLFLPYIASGETRFAPTARLGVLQGGHPATRPLLICLDEVGKSSPDVINAVLPLLLERRLAEHPLPEGSIVFATTNLSAEGLGDSVPPHAVNRMGVLNMRKPTADEWSQWAMDNGVSPEVIAWVESMPSCMQSFTESMSPGDNPYIYHPERVGEPFVSPRSLEKSSGVVAARSRLSSLALDAALSGIVGRSAASDMRAYLEVGRDNPGIAEVVKDPAGARLPSSAMGSMVMALSMVQSCDADTAGPIARYVRRMPRESQRVFLVRLKSSSRFSSVMSDRSLLDLMSANHSATTWTP